MTPPQTYDDLRAESVHLAYEDAVVDFRFDDENEVAKIDVDRKGIESDPVREFGIASPYRVTLVSQDPTGREYEVGLPKETTTHVY